MTNRIGELHYWAENCPYTKWTLLHSVKQLKEIGAGHAFFWSGRIANDRHEAGIGFAMKNDKLSSHPQGIGDRLMTMKQVMIFSANVHNMSNPDNIKANFNSLAALVSKSEKLIILDD